MATTITSPDVTELGNEIADGEQPVLVQPPLFCWTIPDEARAKGRVANNSRKMEDSSRKITGNDLNFFGIDFRITPNLDLSLCNLFSH